MITPIKIVLIGNANKYLTFNVINAIHKDNRYKLELVVLKKKLKIRQKTNRLTNFIRAFKSKGINYVYNRLLFNEIPGFANLKYNVSSDCRELGIKVLETENLNSVEVKNEISNINPDIIVLAGSSLINEHIFKLAKLFTINIHRSLLPKYAGLNSIFWALYFDEPEIGATVHTVNKGIDSGEIILQHKRKIGENDDLETLTKWYYSEAPKMILKSLEIVTSPNPKFIKQDKTKRSYYSRPTEKQKRELYFKLKKKR